MFGPNPSNRANEFSLAVQQANSKLRDYQQGAGVRMFVAPEYYWSGYGEIGHSSNKTHGPLVMERDNKHVIYEALKTASKQAGSLVIVGGSIFYQKTGNKRTAAYNVCPVLSNGAFLLKSYKHMDDKAAAKNEGSPTFDYKTSNPYFKFKDVRFGLEVCGEHNDRTRNEKRLKDWATANKKIIDVQIIVSDSMSIFAGAVAARQGGYVVQCDIGSTGTTVGVYPASGPFNNETALAALGNSGEQINGGVVHYYKITV